MPQKKHPQHAEFKASRGEWLNDLPEDYAAMVKHNLSKIGVTVPKRRIWDVRHGNTIDMEILNELKRVAFESKAAKQLVAV